MTAALLMLTQRGQVLPPYVPDIVTPPVSVSAISSPAAAEGGTLVFTVALSAATAADEEFAYARTGTAAAGDIGSPSFSAGVTLAGAVLTVPSGVAAFTVSYSVTDDADTEDAETVILTIGGVSGTGTIEASDAAPSPASFSYTDTFGLPPQDWLQDRYDGINSWGNSETTLVAIWPSHGAEVGALNPMLCCATSQPFNTPALDSQVFPFQVKVWGAADGTATTVNSVAGSNVIPAWPSDLTPGDYAYRMQDPIAGWTSWRGFRVRADAVHEDLPAIGAAYASVAAKAHPRMKPPAPVLAAYGAGQLNRPAYDAMITRIGAIPAAPTAATAGGSQALAELTYCSDLVWAYYVDSNASHITALASRINGNGTTTGMALWPWATYVDDTVTRFGAIAFGIALDLLESVPGSITAPQLAAARAAAGVLVERQNTYFAYISTTVGTLAGRWPGQRAISPGHNANGFACVTVPAIALVGHEADITVGQAAHVATLLKWLPVTLRTTDAYITDDGTYFEGGNGYGKHSTDFGAALFSAGHAVGFEWSRGARATSWAAKSNDLYPATEAFHAGEGGDDYSVGGSVDERQVSAARRAGIAQYLRERTLGGLTEALLSSDRAIDYKDLAPVAPAAATLPVRKAVHGRYVTALHSDPGSMLRTSHWLRHSPDGGWGHAPGGWGWTMTQAGQAMFLHAVVNDNNIQSRHSKGEAGMAAAYNGIVCFGTTLTAASSGQRGGNRGRRVRTLTLQAEHDADTGVTFVVQDITAATALCASIPVTTASAWLNDLVAKPAAVEQTFTVTVNAGGTTFTVEGDVSGSLGAAFTSAIDTTHFWCQVSGTYVAGDVFTFQVQKVTKARAWNIGLPGGVLISGAHYVFPTARPVAVRFDTRDVRAFASATVSAGVLTLPPVGGVGLPGSQSVAVEISGVTGGTATNATSCNAVHTGTVSADGLSVTVSVGGLGVGNGTITGSIRANLGPSAPAGLGGTVTVACRSRTSAALAVAQHIPVKVPTSRTLNNPAWFLGDGAFAGTVNASADEYGGLAAGSKVYHRWHNLFGYGSQTELFDWLTITAPAGVVITGVSQSESGTAGSRVKTINLTADGEAYSFSVSEATDLIS